MSGTPVGNGNIGMKTTTLLSLGISQSLGKKKEKRIYKYLLKVWTTYHEDLKKGRGTKH